MPPSAVIGVIIAVSIRPNGASAFAGWVAVMN
jgi:hypothetical protein